MSLNPWSDRWAPEEANHFNPAYCGVLIMNSSARMKRPGRNRYHSLWCFVPFLSPFTQQPAGAYQGPLSQGYCRGSKRTAMSKWGLLTVREI